MTPTPYTDTAPAWDAQAVTPSTDFINPRPRALYVGGAGNLVIEGNAGAPVTLPVGAGQFLPFGPSRILPATTATAIVALY